jgi:hypothetical protein
MGAGTDRYLSNLKMKIVVSAGFGFLDKPQPKYGFDYTLYGKVDVAGMAWCV